MHGPEYDPELTPRPSAPKPAPIGKGLSMLIVVTAIVLVAVVLFALAILTSLPFVFALAGVSGVAAFHYVVWGWWLGKRIHAQVEQEMQEEAEKQPRGPE